jgi:chromosomal replication initiation ATPase DnaA
MKLRSKAAGALHALATHIDDAVRDANGPTSGLSAINRGDARHLVIELRATALEFTNSLPAADRVQSVVEQALRLHIRDVEGATREAALVLADLYGPRRILL